MNTKQKITLKVTAIITLFMFFFPPYIVVNQDKFILKTGYGFLFTLHSNIMTYGKEWPALINISVWLIQIFVPLIICGIIYFLQKNENK